jgi:mono/diheme cytochrome c family protein
MADKRQLTEWISLAGGLVLRLAACLTVVALLTAASARGDDEAPSQAEKLFAAKVLPLLKAKCFACHGDDPKDLRGGLSLNSREGMLAGGKSDAPALVAGKPEHSPLYVAVTRSNPDLAMPPKVNDKLSADEVVAIREWIAGGAPWPAAKRLAEIAAASDWAAKDGVTVSTSGGLSPEWTNRRYKAEDLWAYRPLSKRAMPRAAGLPVRHAIDAFLSVQLQRIGLEPAPLADRRTLIRRATFDLIGLPPTPEAIEEFVRDSSSDDEAFSRLVERLLASPHYGEQSARHWLDVARYADSAGLANDYERGSAWRYRDYVVRAFNADKPYDQFIREQLAGDEIDADNPELLIAVGFLRMGAWELTGMEVPKVARQRFLDDLTETVGQVFLAHALQCARCHDHKFDPVPTRDYYRIQAALATTQIAERPAAFLPSENTQGFAERKYLEARRIELQAILKQLDAKRETAARQWCADRGLPYVPRARGLREGITENRLPPAHIGLDTYDLGMERIARKGLERLAWQFERYEPFALSVYSGKTPNLRAVNSPLRVPSDRLTAGELEATAILAGGDPFSPQDKVTPGILSAASALSSAGAPQQLSSAGIESRRKALADWIASSANPLTARVMVNRIWQGHFGIGLAGNANNFGATGKKPTHPELLDWLAGEFIRSGWSVKSMHRLILTSDAYRRASRHPDPQAIAAKDIEGTSYAVYRPRRLAAEELRDAMLSVSGELNLAVGGIPIRPELNAEIALQPRQVMGTFAPAWEASPRPEQRHRRSLYALRLRGLRDPFFEAFNQPSAESSCDLRETSTVAPQALHLLNSQATTGRALAFALRLLREKASKSEIIDRAFRLSLGRPPIDLEARVCLQHWERMTLRHRSQKIDRPPQSREVTREAVEENTGERFKFTETLHAAADFVPDAHPADFDPEVRGLMEVCLVLLNTNEFAYVD